MTPTPLRALLCLITTVAALGLSATASARSEQWKDPTGNTFSANPSQVLGPWALFDNGTLLPLSSLSDEDCVRFYNGVKDQPARSNDWATAKSSITVDVYGRLMHYNSKSELETDNEKGRQEPELYIIFFTTGDRNKSWNELGPNSAKMFAKLKKNYPDLVEGFVFGVGEVLQDHYDIATNTRGDWLFTNFETEVQMRTIAHIIPSNLYGILLVTRDGIPLVGPQAGDDIEIKDDFDKIGKILAQVTPTNPKWWVSEAHYVHAVQPVAYANGKSDPVLIGNPLSAAILAQMKISKVDAAIKVAADGRVQSVTIDPSTVPDKYNAMFTDGFKTKCQYVAAVDHGKFVDGTLHYHLDAAPAPSP